MADFQPFHGLRYNPLKVELAAVVAPPYDVIKGAMRDKLVARSPYNVVEVELPAGDGDSKYNNAARILGEWQAAGILVRDDPAFYVYEQEFQVPGGTARLKRRGVLGALQLEEFGKGVQPHEHTLSGPKEDRLKLLRATHTNTSPIFGLFADSDGWVNALLDGICSGHPLGEAVDGEDVTHRLWRLTDDESVNAIVAALEDEPLLIADGHHRYETALNYRNERAAAAGQDWTGEEPENRVLMMCVSTSDVGLIVLPTHRLVKNADPARIEALLGALGTFFDIEAVTAEGAAARSAAVLEQINAGGESGPIGLGVHLGGQTYRLTLRTGGPHTAAMDSARSAAYNELDVTVLHRLILELQLGIGAAELAAGNHVAYTIDAAEAISKVDAGDYQAAFILRPTRVQQVQDVAAAGDKMPQKSTYFYPKLITGIVLRSMA